MPRKPISWPRTISSRSSPSRVRPVTCCVVIRLRSRVGSSNVTRRPATSPRAQSATAPTSRHDTGPDRESSATEVRRRERAPPAPHPWPRPSPASWRLCSDVGAPSSARCPREPRTSNGIDRRAREPIRAGRRASPRAGPARPRGPRRGRRCRPRTATCRGRTGTCRGRARRHASGRPPTRTGRCAPGGPRRPRGPPRRRARSGVAAGAGAGAGSPAARAAQGALGGALVRGRGRPRPRGRAPRLGDEVSRRAWAWSRTARRRAMRPSRRSRRSRVAATLACAAARSARSSAASAVRRARVASSRSTMPRSASPIVSRALWASTAAVRSPDVSRISTRLGGSAR